MMRTFAFMLTIVFVAAVFGTTAVFAQSSGSFAASYGLTACAITASDGTLTGGIGTQNPPGTAKTSLPDVTVKVSSGNGVALVITPSLVTALYTQNKLSANSPLSTQNVGLRVKVKVDGSTANVIPELGINDGVIYDQRFQQVSATFLSQLTACLTDCFTMVQSTLAAHSFNFYVSNLAPGTHTVSVSWDIIGGTNGEGTCVGPGTLTVEQVKSFSFSSGVNLFF